MKKIVATALVFTFFTACEGAGDRTYTKDDAATGTPGETDQRNAGPYDSTHGVQDSSTNTAYDTGAVRKN